MGAARSIVVADPALWLLGALSFCVRGGVLLILLPIVWVPSPVLLSVFLGRYLTTSGLSPDVVPVAISVVFVVFLAVLAALLLAAYVQLASFERIAGRQETDALRLGQPVRTLSGRERAAVVWRLTVLSASGLLPSLLLLPVIGQRIGAAGLSELQFPSSTETPLAILILGRVQTELLLLAGVVVVMDLLTSLAGHQLIAARLGLGPARAGRQHPDLRGVAAGMSRLIRQPFRTALLFLLSWLLTIGAVAVAVGGTVLGWDTLRAMLFRQTPVSPADGEIAFIGQLVALAIFGVIWVASITLQGIASSLRGALWTTNSLH
jgi:hypothetical protein